MESRNLWYTQIQISKNTLEVIFGTISTPLLEPRNCLYREEFTASDIDALHDKLRDSWSKISIEELGNDTDGKMILINLEQ